MKLIKPGSTRKNNETQLIKNEYQGGHFARAYLTRPESFQEFSTFWKVPSNPKQEEGLKTLFFWNAMQSTKPGGLFVQPVLCWGPHWQEHPGESGGGRFWEVYNVYFFDGKYHSTKTIRVNSGDELVGVISLDSFDGDNYNYKFGFLGDKYKEIDTYVSAKVPFLEIHQCFEPYLEGDNYLENYPPDDYIDMQDIDVTYNDGSKEKKLEWQFSKSDDAPDLPSHKYGEVISDSGNDGIIRFYFR